jgi:hypothetical protein
MGKLSNFVFKDIVRKEIECMGKKIEIKALSTRDTMAMNIGDFNEKMNTKEILNYAIELLSHSIVSVDGTSPDDKKDTREMLENQAPEVVFDILEKYNKFIGESSEQIKN